MLLNDKYQKIYYNSIMKLEKIKNFIHIFKFEIISLFFASISFAVYSIFYVYALFILISLVFLTICLFKRKYLSLINLLIVIISILVYIFYYRANFVDPHENKNVIIGTWLYNENGGVYIFNDDYTYFQYATNNTDDNYCKGNYSYSFGYESNEGKLLLSDKDYIYYHLLLNPTECIVSGVKDKKAKYKKEMIFSYPKRDVLSPIITNISSEKYFILKQQKEK